jgi:uncharacterized delta-60 repeat protein
MHRIARVAAFGLCALAWTVSAAAQSALDGFTALPNDDVTTLAVQPDGKILVGGYFSNVSNGFNTIRLARLNANGTVDTGFFGNIGGFALQKIALQPDGKILVGGNFTTAGGGSFTNIARLNANGGADNTFTGDVGGTVWDIAVQPDGKIVVVGGFIEANGVSRQRIARLNADGSLDATFDPGADNDIHAVALQPDGKIIVAGQFNMLGGGGAGTTARAHLGRINPDGSLDTSFTAQTNGVDVSDLAVQPDGRILVGGGFGVLANSFRSGIGRLLPSGAIDPSFNPGANGAVWTIAIRPDGDIIVGGGFTMIGGGGSGTIPRRYVARLRADGTVDPVFNPGVSNPGGVWAVAVQTDGGVLLGGPFSFIGGGAGTTLKPHLGRVYPDGSVDADWNPVADGTALTAAIQRDGRILIGGNFATLGGASREYFGRLLPNGALDTSFAPNTDRDVRAIAVQPDGRIVIGGVFVGVFDGVNTTGGRIGRLNEDGTVDDTFRATVDDTVNVVALQSDGKIVVGGYFEMAGSPSATTPRSRLARFNADGTLDVSFNPGANGIVQALVVQPDGKILVGGTFTTLAGVPKNYFGRLNSDGSIDMSFSGGANNDVTAIGLQADGKVLVGGFFTTLGGGGLGTAVRLFLGRVNSNGSADAAFNPGASSNVLSFLEQADGKILLAGPFTGVGAATGATPRRGIARLNADGTVDSTFDPGTNGTIYGLAQQSDGKVIAVGSFSTLGGGGTGVTPRSNVGRLSNNTAALNNMTVASDGTNTVRWMRSGSSPELARVGIDISSDGVSFAPLGVAARVIGGLELASPALPPGQYLTFRANGIELGGNGEGSSSIIETALRAYLPGNCSGIAPLFPPSGMTNVAYSQQFTLAGADGPVTWEILGTLPGGMTFSNGLLSGTPSEPGTFLLTVTATDTTSNCASQLPFTLIVYAAPLVNQIKNGDFSQALTNWKIFATPNLNYIVTNVNGGVFEYYRVPPPAGTSNQAVIFQETGVPFAAGAPIVAQFDLRNSSSVRKRISVLILDANFSDLSVCTFWLEPNTSLATYRMRTHTTTAWTNAAIYFYAATAGSNGGSYGVDNVAMYADPTASAVRTDCEDPTKPFPGEGEPMPPELVTNPGFSSGMTGWGLFGQITSRIDNGVFEFVRPMGTPAGVILQATGQPMAARTILTAFFTLGNSSSVRKRVTVLIHDTDFSDLAACTFWLAPGQPLGQHAMELFTTKAWTNATVSVYPSTVGLDEWIRLDDVSLKRTQASPIIGTRCFEPGALDGPGGGQ